MYVDAQMLLSDAQALTATAFSTNTIDLASMTPQRDPGVGEPLEVNIQVDVAADFTTGDETYTFQFVQSANANLSSPDILVQEVVLASALTAGAGFTIAIPQGRITKRYIGLQYTLAGTTPTVTVTAFVQPRSMSSLPKPATHAKGYTIS